MLTAKISEALVDHIPWTILYTQRDIVGVAATTLVAITDGHYSSKNEGEPTRRKLASTRWRVRVGKPEPSSQRLMSKPKALPYPAREWRDLDVQGHIEFLKLARRFNIHAALRHGLYLIQCLI